MVAESLKEVKRLQKEIKNSSKKIDKIQKNCKHQRILHKSFPDIYGNQGVSSECADCGKFISCASIPFLLSGKSTKASWIEDKRNKHS